MVECTLSITHCLRLNLQLHTIDLVRTCRTSSFCTVAWQLARFQLTRCIARSLGDSWASCDKELHKHTHLTALLPGLLRWAGTKKNKNQSLDFTEARDSEWRWHQLGHMQTCTSFQTDNPISTPPLSFLQAGCPSCRPTNSVKALKANLNSLTKVILNRKKAFGFWSTVQLGCVRLCVCVRVLTRLVTVGSCLATAIRWPSSVLVRSRRSLTSVARVHCCSVAE